MQKGRRQVWRQVGGVHPLRPPDAVIAGPRCRLARWSGREEQYESPLSTFGPFMQARGDKPADVYGDAGFLERLPCDCVFERLTVLHMAS